jgi:hypothetical protein
MCIDSAACAEELESLGLDVMKDELSKLGMKCSGTLKERAERLWQSRGISDMPMFLSEHPELVPGRDKEKRSRCTRFPFQFDQNSMEHSLSPMLAKAF